MTKNLTHNKRGYYLIYTALFLIIALIVFQPYLAARKSLLWDSDGLRQHYIALIYIGQWGREILKNILYHHSAEIPLWNFHIGYGSDIITTFHYYVLGDPLNLLSIFVQPKYTEYLYSFLILLRMYLSGIGFSCYCFCMNKGKKAALIGTFSYVFCGYMLFAATRHPFFANGMILFPLLLTGAERILYRQKPALFISMVFLSAISNFYFFYMLVIGVCFYVTVRFFTISHTQIFREFFSIIFRFARYAIVGVLMSAVILLPVLIQFTSSNRTGIKPSYPLFYDKSYYLNFLLTFASTKRHGLYLWTLLGFTLPALLGIIVLFTVKRRHTALKISFILTTGMLLFPFFGSVMNGFSYVSNRWCFMYAFLVSFILVTVWNDAKVLYKKCSPRLLSAGLLAITLAHICLNSHALYNSKLLTHYVDFGTALGKIMATPPEALNRSVPQDERFYRYEMDDFDIVNSAVPIGTNGIQFYWSLENPCISEYLMDMSIKNFQVFNYRDLDHRTFLDTLAGVKYFIKKSTNYKPYGFLYKDTVSLGPDRSYKIYENQYALPIAYTYQSQISYEIWQNLSPARRQQALLQGVVLDETNNSSPISIPEIEPSFTEQSINYTISHNETISSQSENRFDVKEDGAELTLSFQGLENCETYLFCKGTQITTDHPDPLSAEDNNFNINISSNQSDNKLRHMNFYHKYSTGQTDYLVNLGYHKKAQTYITITFPRKGTYQFDDIQVICQPMRAYPSQINALKKDVLQNETIGANIVTGSIDLNQDKILCFSIPYSKGWRAFVDGEEQPLQKANIMYMALPLSKGTHTIELHYRTPGLFTGIILSCLGMILFGCTTIYEKKKQQIAKFCQ